MTEDQLRAIMARLTHDDENQHSYLRALLRISRANANAAERNAQAKAVDALTNLTVTQIKGQRRIVDAFASAEEAQRELRLRQLVADSDPEVANAIIAAEVERQKRLLELDRVRNARRFAAQALPAVNARGGMPDELLIGEVVSGMMEPAAPTPNVQPDISEDAIRRLATKAVFKLHGLPPDVAERELQLYLSDLRQHMPKNVMVEVEEKIEQLRADLR